MLFVLNYGVLFRVSVTGINAKYMKYLIFINLILFSLSSYAIEFYRCSDASGKVHLTTMPKSSLDANCKQKSDQYAVMLEQDYLNLSNRFKKYEIIKEPDDIEFTLENFTKPVMELLDADKALDELLENTKTKRNSEVSKFFRARSDAVESILSEEKPNTPPDSVTP
jgi:hypothetical protein